jgi:hypothetical protein
VVVGEEHGIAADESVGLEISLEHPVPLQECILGKEARAKSKLEW